MSAAKLHRIAKTFETVGVVDIGGLLAIRLEEHLGITVSQCPFHTGNDATSVPSLAILGARQSVQFRGRDASRLRAVDSAWTAEDDAEFPPAFEKGFASVGNTASIRIGDEDVFGSHAQDNHIMIFQKRVLNHCQNGLARGKILEFAEITEITFEFISRVERAQTAAEHIGWSADGGAGVRRDSNLAFASSQPQMPQRGDRSGRSAGVVGALNADAVRVEARWEPGEVSVIRRRSSEGPDRVECNDQRQKGSAEKPNAPISGHAKQRPEQKNWDDRHQRKLGSPARNP